MRSGDSMSIGQLIEPLGVTATAVRQRIDRLLEMGLIQREKVVSGRGRPTYSYQLTVDGHRRLGANPVDLADALWREMLAIEDAELRRFLEQTQTIECSPEDIARWVWLTKGQPETTPAP